MSYALIYRCPTWPNGPLARHNARACVPLAAFSDDYLWVRFLPFSDGSGADATEVIPVVDLKWERQGLPRGKNGELSSYAWPGGYQIYYVCQDGGTLCPACANEHASKSGDEWDPQWNVVGADVNYEDPSLYCDHCNARIESAYAEDRARFLGADLEHSADDLVWFLATFKRGDGNSLFPEEYPPSVRESTLRDLRRYARAKLRAMRLRERGEISRAMMLEDAADRFYSRLPEFAKW